MDAPEIVVGLDIGTTKIACLVGRKTEHGKIEILGVGKSPSIGVKRGVVSNIRQTVESIRAAVEEAEAKSGVEIKIVNVGIAGQHIKSMQHRGMINRGTYDEEIGQQDVDNLIDDMYNVLIDPGEEIIHVLPQEYIVDRQNGIKDPIGMAGVQLEANFHIITGQIAAARNIYRCVHQAGLEVAELILEPLASSSSVLSEEEKEAGVVLVDIGGGTTDIAIFHDGIIRHTAVIPFGGEIITNDIKEGCTIMERQAELLKTKFGTALSLNSQDNEVVCIPGLRGRDPKEISVKNLCNIINARLSEIIEHVYFEIKNSGYEKKLIGGIVITGGGSQMKHITQLFEFVTGMDARIGYPNEHLSSNTNINVTSPLFATGVGLVAKGFEQFEKEKAKESSSKSVVKTRQHSVKTKGGFLDKFKNWFDDSLE
jgi:cell division protein FtsA